MASKEPMSQSTPDSSSFPSPVGDVCGSAGSGINIIPNKQSPITPGNGDVSTGVENQLSPTQEPTAPLDQNGIKFRPMDSRLFVSNIPKTKTQTELMIVFGKLSDGLKDVIVYKDGDLAYAKNRGFCFLDYESPEKAKTAKAILLSVPEVMGFEIKVDDADPEVEVDEEVMKSVRVLYVKNLGPAITQAALEQLFASYGHASVRKIKNFAFVNFDDREKAEKAMLGLNRTWMDGSLIEIEWARPPVSQGQRERILKAREERRSRLNLQVQSPAAQTPRAPMAPAQLVNYYHPNITTSANVGLGLVPPAGLSFSNRATGASAAPYNHLQPYPGTGGTTYYRLQQPAQVPSGFVYGHGFTGTGPTTYYNAGHAGGVHATNPPPIQTRPETPHSFRPASQQRYGSGTNIGKQRTY